MENVRDFVDCQLRLEPEPIVAFRCSMTTYVESLTNGQYVGRQWNSMGIMPILSFDPASHPAPQAFWLEIDGQLLNSHWEWADHSQSKEDSKLHVKTLLRHTVRPVEVCVNTVLDGSGILCRWLDIKNTGSAPAALSTVAPWSGVLYTGWQMYINRPAEEDKLIYSLGYVQDARDQGEGSFDWVPLRRPGHSVEGRYMADRHRHPMFILKNELTGHHFIGQLAWSGGYRFDFQLSGDRYTHICDNQLFFRAGLDAPAPVRIIEPGETVTTPEMSLGVIAGDFDQSVQAMHEHIRRTYMPKRARSRGCWVETGIGPEVEITSEVVYRTIDLGAEIGAEVFFIDASWYSSPNTNWANTTGDWNVGSRFPNGLAEFREHAHSKGLLWGLWMEPERLGCDSKTIQEHPDWNKVGYNGKNLVMLDLTRPEVARWMEDQVCRVIDENQLDFFRLDHNCRIGTGGTRLNSGYVENTYWRYYEAFYGIFDRVRKRFPDLIMEGCASGGGRTDLGIMKYFDHTWVTDYQPAPWSFAIGNGMTICLPPELVDRHLVGIGQQNYVASNIEFQMRASLFGRPTVGLLEWRMETMPNDAVMESVKHGVKIYKDFVREFMPTGRFYHHTPTLTSCRSEGIGIMELASADRSRAIAGVFRLAGDQSDCVLRMRGLDAGKRYRVTADNTCSTFDMDGKDLVYTGLPIHLDSPLTSELIICKEI